MQTTKHNATCSICGKSYYMCMSCKDQQLLSPWKIHTDTSEHYKVYQILHGLSVGVYNEQEAKEKLNNVDLSDKASFLPNIKKRVNRILNFTNTSNAKDTKAIVDDFSINAKDDGFEVVNDDSDKQDEKPINKFFNSKKK